MNLLNKLTIKNLLLNKKRTIVTIIGIILSVALICAVSSMYASGIASLIKFETEEKGNYHASFYNVLASDIKTIQNNRGIEEIYVTKNIGYANLKDSKNEYKPYAFVKASTKSSFANLAINLVSGRLPEKENEIVIPTHLKTNGRIILNVGDTITLAIGERIGMDGVSLKQNNPYQKDDETESTSEKLIDTKEVTYKIVGLIERPSTSIEPYDAPGYTFITYMDEFEKSDLIDVFARYNKKGSNNYIDVTASILGVNKDAFNKYLKGCVPTSEEFDKILKEVNKAKYHYNLNSYLIALENNPLSNETVGSLSTVIIVVIIIIIFTSVSCIKNSFDISITEKIKQYGMLKSIGATKKQIKKNVFYEASILGLIGIPLGILSGIFASYILIIVCNYFMKDFFASEAMRLIFSYSWSAILISAILGIITLYLSAFNSARKASKISPINSIKNSANIKLTSKKVKGSKIIHNLFGIGGDISYKNIKRNKRKYRTTVISIIISVTVFISLSSFMNMAYDEVKKEFKNNEYNLYLTVRDDNSDVNALAISTTKLDNIKEYTIARDNYFKIEQPKFSEEFKKFRNRDEEDDYGITMIAVGKSEYQKYINKLGLNYDDVKDKGILFNNILVNIYNNETGKQEKHYYDVFDYKEGDILTGMLNDSNLVNIEIAKVVKELPFGFKNNNGSSKIIVSDEYFDSHCQNSNVSIYYLANDASKVQDQIDEILNDQDYYLENSEENKKMMDNFYTLVGIFLYGFIIVITLIGITNIFNTITTNMALRKGEFAMLKSIGMTKGEFNRLISLESLFMGLKSLLFGTIFGVLLSYVMFSFLKTEGDVFKLPIMAIIICFIGVMLLISIIMKYSINKINKQNIIETIRNENI